MESSDSVDLIPLEHHLHELLQSLRASGSEVSWLEVQNDAQEIANHLRVRNSTVDHHTILGRTGLPQTLTSLLSLGLEGSHIAKDDKTTVINEILRVGANLCMDHNDNRATLLEAGFPQAVITLLEGYAETIPHPPAAEPLPLTIAHLNVVRTCIGVLLNASLNFDAAKFRLISLEAPLTIIKLSSVIFPPTSWTTRESEPGFDEEWGLRSLISNWIWRAISTFKEVQDDSLRIINSEVLPWITPALLKFCPPQASETSPLAERNPDLLDTLVQTDYEFLEEACTLIESSSLDVEDFRLEFARATCYPEKGRSVPCLRALLQFIEEGSYPPIWKNPIYDESERKTREKGFDICKAAVIKAFVEVFGEEKNEDALWKNDDSTQPGGDLVARLVHWIKDHLNTIDSQERDECRTISRDDLTICASLSLGNLARKPNIAVSLLSPPYSLAPALASLHFLSPSTDLKLKHGILGLLKHLAQFAKLSPIIPKSLGEVNIIQKLSSSGIWDQETDAIANIIQLNAIGVAKHLCNSNLEQTFAIVLPTEGNDTTGFSQILALIKRSDSVSVKSEGSRVVVNVVKSLWLLERGKVLSEDTQKKREKAVSIVLTEQCTQILTALIARSNKYPILVNEGIIAITLLSTHRQGGPLVLNALLAPVNEDHSTRNNASPGPPTPPSVNDGLLVPRHALDMLVYALSNVDNPVNFPVEVRVNICNFLLQLQKNVPAESLARVKEEILPVARQVVEESQDDPQEEKLLKAASLLLQLWSSA